MQSNNKGHLNRSNQWLAGYLDKHLMKGVGELRTKLIDKD